MRSSLVHERARFGASSNEKLRTPKLCPTEMNLHQKAFRYAFDGDPTFRDLERRALMRELQHHHLTPNKQKTEPDNRRTTASRFIQSETRSVCCDCPIPSPHSRSARRETRNNGTDTYGELPPPADEK
jgi:hypothetical protein